MFCIIVGLNALKIDSFVKGPDIEHRREALTPGTGEMRSALIMLLPTQLSRTAREFTAISQPIMSIAYEALRKLR